MYLQVTFWFFRLLPPSRRFARTVAFSAEFSERYSWRSSESAPLRAQTHVPWELHKVVWTQRYEMLFHYEMLFLFEDVWKTQKHAICVFVFAGFFLSCHSIHGSRVWIQIHTLPCWHCGASIPPLHLTICTDICSEWLVCSGVFVLQLLFGHLPPLNTMILRLLK